MSGNATSPLHSRGSPKKKGDKSQLGPTTWRKCYITPAFSGIPKDNGDKIRIGGAHERAQMLHHPCILGDLQRKRGTKSELAGPTSGWKCYITPAFSGIPKHNGDKIRIDGAHKRAEMLHHPYILRDPQQTGQNQSKKKKQKNKNKNFPLVSLILLVVLHTDPIGV